MFCRACGKPLDDTLKFCPNCGDQVDQIAEVSPSQINLKTTSNYENIHDYASDLKNGFNCFISYITAVIKTPTMNLESINTYLTTKKLLAYVSILAVIYSIIQCILFKILYSGFVSMIDSITSQIPYGFADKFGTGIQGQFYSQRPQWFRLFITNFLFIIMFVCILSLLALVVYTLIMKKATKFIDFVKLYLSSLVLLVIISFIAMITAVISLNLMLVIALIGAILYITSITINFVNLLKNESRVIYTLPFIVFSSLFLTYFIYIKIM